MVPQNFSTFYDDYSAASNDYDLLTVLRNELGSCSLSAPNRSELVSSTYEIAEFSVRAARKHYGERPERLRFVVSSSERQNAYAVWGRSEIDWIVITEGLIHLLANEAEKFADRLIQSFPDLFKDDIKGRLDATEPLAGGFTTALGSFVFFGAISFFVGHESGHHLSGHDGYYLASTPFGAHVEASEELKDDKFGVADLTRHALELQADRLGAIIYCAALMTKLAGLWSTLNQTTPQQTINQHAIAVLLHSSALLATQRIKPSEVDWNTISKRRSHPPAAIRILQLSLAIGKRVQELLLLLDEQSRRWIRINSLEIALGLTITPKSEAWKKYTQRMNRSGEPLALRATGLRKLIYDDDLLPYLGKVDAQAEIIKSLLRPRISRS